MSKKLSELRKAYRRASDITVPIRRKRVRWNRNWSCLCGSKKKYKRCCMGNIEDLTSFDGNVDTIELPEYKSDFCKELGSAVEVNTK